MQEIYKYPMNLAGINITAFGRGKTVYSVVFGDVSRIKSMLESRFRLLHGKEADEIPRVFEEYFRNGVIEKLEPEFLWGTSFQRAVWEEISKVSTGKRATYGQIAERIGRSCAARAVGQAVGANPIPIIVPCHRVFAKNGLGGFSAGIDIKRKLLNIEGFSLT